MVVHGERTAPLIAGGGESGVAARLWAARWRQ
jgi:hypothetical protein